MTLKIGVSLGLLSPRAWPELAQVADERGFESVWIPEHLVLPVQMGGSPHPGEEHPPVPPDTQVFDAWVYLAHLAGRCPRVRLGTFVYNLGLRHPFVSARAIATLDVVSGGRTEVGIGASWLESEWRATGLDFATRGRRVDETLDVCRRLWDEPVVEHHGTFFDFDPVMFEPKPLQRPAPPVHVGGVSEAAFRRAARAGDGWIGMRSVPDDVTHPRQRLAALRREYGRDREPFEITVGGAAQTRDDVARWEEAGVTRLLLTDLGRSRDAADALRRRADTLFG